MLISTRETATSCHDEEACSRVRHDAICSILLTKDIPQSHNIFKEIKILPDYRVLPKLSHSYTPCVFRGEIYFLLFEKNMIKVAILFDSKTFPTTIKTYQDSRCHQDCLEYKTWISASFNN